MTKDLEACANAWANKFVDANLRPHLASGLRQLEDSYLEELFKLKVRLRKTPFIAMGVTKNYVFVAHTNRDVLHSVISWFIRGILYFHYVLLLFPFYEFSLRFKLCLRGFFARDVVDAGKFVFSSFNLFFRPRSGTMFLLKSSRLTNYIVAVQNPRHCQYGYALYVQWSIQMTYVKKQDLMEQMGDMLDSAMRRTNVARQREISAPLPVEQKNAPPWKEGVLRIKFSFIGIEQCEGED
jgi:hypothetical protein